MTQQLRTDSPISHRIVRSFLHFLTEVEPAPGVDVEGLEVVKQCLAEVFNVDPSSAADSIPDGDSLINIFHSQTSSKVHEYNSNHDLNGRTPPCPEAPGPSAAASIENAKHTEGEDRRRDQHVPDISIDELFGQFIGALEQIRYFKSTPDGNDDPVQMDKASQVFYSAVEDLQRSGCATLHPKTLAESLKTRGNKAMQSNHYSEAIEFYTFAIALDLNNAVYYCNRAAAYTQIHQYAEAIDDCLKAGKIDPNYSKAYSRLGFAYYAQGKYADAIEKGFNKALQLDPNNEHVRENIRVAEQKLREEHHRAQHSQNPGSTNGQPHHQSAGGPRTSMPEAESFFMNMFQGRHSHGPGDDINADDSGTGINYGNINFNFGERRTAEDSSGQPNQQSTGGPRTSMPFNLNEFTQSIFSNMTQGRHSPEDDPGREGNISINFGEQMSAEVTGAVMSVMEMFSGVTPGGGGGGEDDVNRRPSS